MEAQSTPPQAAHATTGQAPQTDGFAIGALVTGILGMNLIAVILGHVSLNRIKNNPSLGGGGMAIAGLVLGYIALAFWLLWFTVIAALIASV